MEQPPVSLPRVRIEYCTQCKWMLRAAYFGQELLSTFGTSIGEIALVPATGGIFTAHLTYQPVDSSQPVTVLLWDRKSEGGFPETKILKQKLRNHIDPSKNLGHSDTPSKAAVAIQTTSKDTTDTPSLGKPSSESNSADAAVVGTETCEDCK